MDQTFIVFIHRQFQFILLFFFYNYLGFDENEALVGTQIMYAAPDLFGVAKELWNILGPYALLQKHLSEITEDDIEFSKTILNFYCGPLENLSIEQFENFTKTRISGPYGPLKF